MEDDILQVIEEEIASNPSLEEMKVFLLDRGFQEGQVDDALKKHKHHFPESKQKSNKRNSKLFSAKEVLDRVGYGFATHQFINILFYQTAMLGGLGHIALFLVGLFNGLKGLFSSVISSFLQEYQKVNHISKKAISTGGIIFGFSFLVMAFARSMHSPWVFAIALLVGSVGIVSYGDLYNQLLRENLKKERMGLFLRKISQYGIIITAISLLVSGWLMEFIPTTGKVISIAGYSFTAYGYLISFEITAFAFIISGYVLSKIKQQRTGVQYKLRLFINEYRRKIRVQRKLFARNKIIMLLLFASVVSGVVQALGNSFYGIFIYERFKDVMFGGFMNVAIIYTVAIIVSVFGPWITARVHKSIGYSPMLVFGTMLIAMMPFVAAWNPNFYALGAANAISIIGSAIVGVAQGLLARKLLKEEERKLYFASLSMMVVLPFIVLLPVGSWIAQMYGLEMLFKILVYVLVGVAVPLYVILVGFANKRRL